MSKLMHHLKTSFFVSGFMLLVACSQSGTSNDAGDPPVTQTDATAQVPVHVDTVRQQTIDVMVTAPGHTEAARQERIRAPFASRLVSLRVADGDHVKQGQVIAIVVSKNSAAALAGAEQMLAAAHNDADQADAQRAVELARSHLVQQQLTAPAAGVVLSHSAETGDYVDEGEILVAIADADSVYFNAQVSQGDVDRVHAGQTANIELPALGAEPINAVVHGRLPLASTQDFSAPVRLNFSHASVHVQLGLFGIAHIIVTQHTNATVVSTSAILRDDVTGVSRVAIVDSGVAHWLTVDTGAHQDNLVEILKPAITAGTTVITDGQVGLPEGAKVTVQQ